MERGLLVQGLRICGRPSLVATGGDIMVAIPGRFGGRSCIMMGGISTPLYLILGAIPQAIYFGEASWSGGVHRWSKWLPDSYPRNFCVVLVCISCIYLWNFWCGEGWIICVNIHSFGFICIFMHPDNCEHIMQIILNMITVCWFDFHFQIVSLLEFIGVINLEIQ